MFTESEIATYAQDASLAVLEMGEEAAVWTGKFLVLGQQASTFPFNGDVVYARSWAAAEPVLWVEIDSSYPGAGRSAWVSKHPYAGWVFSDNPLDD